VSVALPDDDADGSCHVVDELRRIRISDVLFLFIYLLLSLLNEFVGVLDP
jgi:hypothetical protein